MGAYWGIDTDPGKVNPADALPCDPKVTHELAHVSTRLSDAGEKVAKQLVNWGYAICDRSVRTNYTGKLSPPKPKMPFPDAPLG